MDLTALMNLAKGKKTELAARGNFANVTKPPPGKSRWRILPGWRPTAPHVFYHDFGQHYIKDKDGNVLMVYVCEQDTFGKECEVCDRLSSLMRSTKDDDTLKLLKEMKSRQVHLVNAVRLDGAEADPKKPVLLQLVGSLFQSYLATLEQYQTDDDINILDANEGRNITIERSGSGMNTKYNLTVAASNSAVNEEALSRLIDIDNFIQSESVKGKQKGLAVFENNAKQILSLGGAASSMLVDPNRARLMPPKASRVIEQEDDDVMVEEMPPQKARKAPPAAASAPWDEDDAPEAKPVQAKIKPVSKASEETPLDDDELAKILADLDAE